MSVVILRDPPNGSLIKQAVAPRTVTQTTTGSAQDMITGDGRCLLVLNATATSLTAMTVRVQQSTLTNSGFADVTGASVSVTTDAVTCVAFDRDSRYLQAVATINGTTAVISASIFEQLKTY